MSEKQTSSHNDQVLAAIADFLQAVERGEIVDRKSFLEQNRDIAVELESFFENEAQFRQFVDKADYGLPSFTPRANESHENPNSDLNEPTVKFQGQGISLVREVIDALACSSDKNEDARAREEVRHHSGEPGDAQYAKRGENGVASVAFPTQNGRFRVERVLGKGAFGVVYLAYDSELQRLVAVKVAHAAAIEAYGGLESYVSEGRRLAQLKHPGIVAIYDVGQSDDGLYFLVSEFIEGETLHDTLKQLVRLPPAVAVPIAIYIAEGLQHAHKRGFVHRDLKPANILMDREGKPHILDFGLALHETEQAHRAGEIAGTLRYMSPEQTFGAAHNLDGRSDLWSLGVILYEMLTGRLPFTGETESMLVQQIRERPPRPLRMLDETIPAELERITAKCLEKSTTDRYSSAQALLEDLRFWQHPSTSIAAEPHRKASRAHWPRRLAVAGFAGLAIASLILASMPSPKPDVAPSKPAAAEPLEVGDFRMLHYRDKSTRTESMGELGPNGEETLVKDSVRCQVKFNQPAYAYLVACNTDGTLQLCFPNSETLPPQKLQSFEFPAGTDEGFYLTEGPGQQVFALVASLEPLPMFKDWRKDHESLSWTHCDPAMWVRYRCGIDAKNARQIGEVRGEVQKFKGISAVRELVESLSTSKDPVLVDAIGFPVLPESASTPANGPP